MPAMKGKKSPSIASSLGGVLSTGPQFSPVGGVGSIWEDPNTGETYRFTAQGWVKETKTQGDDKESGSFEVKPDEEGLAERLKEGGSNESQIRQGLAERRRVLGNLGVEEPIEVEEPTQDTQSQNPFEGMTKREVLIDAFNKGVTDPGELDKLETLYEKLAGEEMDEVELARQFIQSNPDAPREELFVNIKRDSDLDTGTINALLDEGKTVSTQDRTTLGEDGIREAATKAVKSSRKFLRDPKKVKEEAKRKIDSRSDVLTVTQRQQIKEVIDELPDGSILNRIFPFLPSPPFGD